MGGCLLRVVTNMDNASLTRVFTDKEVVDVVFQLGGTKALGLMGFEACFTKCSGRLSVQKLSQRSNSSFAQVFFLLLFAKPTLC